jgi:hypothetical protein
MKELTIEEMASLRGGDAQLDQLVAAVQSGAPPLSGNVSTSYATANVVSSGNTLINSAGPTTQVNGDVSAGDQIIQ